MLYGFHLPTYETYLPQSLCLEPTVSNQSGQVADQLRAAGICSGSLTT